MHINNSQFGAQRPPPRSNTSGIRGVRRCATRHISAPAFAIRLVTVQMGEVYFTDNPIRSATHQVEREGEGWVGNSSDRSRTSTAHGPQLGERRNVNDASSPNEIVRATLRKNAPSQARQMGFFFKQKDESAALLLS